MSRACAPRRPVTPTRRSSDTEPRLGAIEYFVADVDQDLATDDDRPSLMSHAFDGPMEGHKSGVPAHYDLHAWVYGDNPPAS